MTTDEAHANEATDLLQHAEHSEHKNLGEDVPLYARPRQRQRWDDEQVLPHVNWGDLFFDLFYVAAAYNLAVILMEAPSWEGFLYFICCYFPVQMMWNEKVMYDARFCPEDNIFHRAVEVLHLFFLGTAIQHIRPVELMQNTSENSTTFVFCLSLTLLTYIEMKRYHDVRDNVVGGEEAKIAAATDFKRKIWSLVPYLLATIRAGRDYFLHNDGEEDEGNNIPILLCLAGYVGGQISVFLEIYVFVPRSGRHFKELRVPLNIDFTIHRLGEWVMLMLGESVLSLLIVEESPGKRYYITFYSGMLSVTLMQYLYFRSNPFEAEDHAMRRDQIGGYLFYHSIVNYSASLIVIGCSFKSILHHYLNEEAAAQGNHGQHESSYSLEETAVRIAHMFCWSLAISFFFLDMMIVSHRGWTANLSRMYSNGHINWGPTVIMALDWTLLIVTATLSQWITDLEILSVVGCFIVVCQVMMRTRGLRFFPVSKRAMEHAHRWPNVTEPRSVAHK